MKLNLPRAGLLLTAGLMILLSCKKTDANKQVSTTVQAFQTSKIEKMSNFLSITLNVSKENVVYNPELKEFSVLNKLKFDYASLEAKYDVANEYKLNHE